ncbi:3-hydroxybutyryl-CoA dehydrogenase FadB3 [Nostocoides japonicum T1-X7]|uniref:3-hydroxybutyryl-CoA dehydrogenase FadB3 n=1 Tax=Nostocoides japonicum T1-X7 TaxID=1194083 RepID=A0A077LZW9_9MICO|nr:3-hydroxyacyl-CoA dehydrogenase family protein [Tetrasphaera japonica]CCH79548.1 3-hydroxybutyryl-CoA dehydrogenase FadB3 [Tetrasphaera japonica T1-X7]
MTVPATQPPEWADRPIAVIGAGTLGRRIALMFATGGGIVRVCDRDASQREKASAYLEETLPSVLDQVESTTPADIEFTETIADAVPDAWLVVESLPERLDIKIPVFGELDERAASDAILATNSSSYPSSQVIDQVSRPERVVNMHFFMPPVATPVEVMSCGHTEEAVFERLFERLPRYGLTPFRVHAESMGFIHNRIWAAIKREALMVLDEGVASPAEVDQLYRMVLGARTGPFRAMDRVGLDVVLDIEENYAAHRDGIPEGPRRLLRRYLDEGRLGMKSGRGFYDDYEPQPGQ